MESRNFTIKNKFGLHTRPAVLLAQTANKFNSKILFTKDGLEVDGKSVMGILILTAECGSNISVKAEGEDALLAIEALGKLIDTKFGED
jgi:phosphocarrier protein